VSLLQQEALLSSSRRSLRNRRVAWNAVAALRDLIVSAGDGAAVLAAGGVAALADVARDAIDATLAASANGVIRLLRHGTA